MTLEARPEHHPHGPTDPVGEPTAETAAGSTGSESARGSGSSERPSVWIVNHYANFPSKDQREGRHFALARHLNARGWNVTIISSGTTHPAGSRVLPWWRTKRAGSEGGVNYLWIATPGYRSNGLSRILNMAAFTASLLLPGRTRNLPQPDVVIGSTVHPFAAWAGLRLARRRRTPFVFEIRDVWPETLVDLGHWRVDGWPTRMLSSMMKHLVHNAELVVAPLPNVDLYLKDIDEPAVPFLWISNGAEGHQELPTSQPPQAEPFVFMYLGSHGHANVLDRLIDGFDLFHRLNPSIDVRFRLVGDGPLKEKLVAQAATTESAGLIEFQDRIPREQVLECAAEAHCLVAVTGDYRVYRYGIGLNKLQDYMLAARPVLLASPAEANLVRAAGAGIAIKDSGAEDIANAMATMVKLPECDRIAMGRSAQKYVLENLTYEHLAASLAEGLDNVLSGGCQRRLP